MVRTTTCCLRSGLLVGKKSPFSKRALLFTYPANCCIASDLPFVFPVHAVCIKSVFDTYFTGFKNRAKSLFPIGLLALSLYALKNENKVKEILK